MVGGQSRARASLAPQFPNLKSRNKIGEPFGMGRYAR